MGAASGHIEAHGAPQFQHGLPVSVFAPQVRFEHMRSGAVADGSVGAASVKRNGGSVILCTGPNSESS
jgi:hypothetical protein